jgi:hypothetical protein
VFSFAPVFEDVFAGDIDAVLHLFALRNGNVRGQDSYPTVEFPHVAMAVATHSFAWKFRV